MKFPKFSNFGDEPNMFKTLSETMEGKIVLSVKVLGAGSYSFEASSELPGGSNENVITAAWQGMTLAQKAEAERLAKENVGHKKPA